MKKIIFSVVTAAVALGFQSCQDFLETSSPSTFTPPTVYENVDYANDAVMGIYSNFAIDRSYAQTLSVNMPTGSDMEFMKFTPDNVGTYTGAGTGDARAIGNHLATPSTAYLKDVWLSLYKTVEYANQVIEGINNSPLMSSGGEQDKAKMRSYLAEATVLRAWCYLEITRIWGDVPFKTTPSQPDGSNFYLPKTDIMDIYQYLIEDVDKVADFLPWGSKAGSKERIQRGFAKGLVARMALYRGGWYFNTSKQWVRKSDWKTYYTIARERCNEIMTSPNNPHGLNPSYQNVFMTQCQRNNDPYGESLFEISMGFSSVGKTGELGHLIGVPFFETSTKYGGTTQFQVQTSAAYFYSFDPNDQRRDVSVTYYRYDKTPKQLIPGDPYDTYHIGKWSLKWMRNDYIEAKKVAGTGKVATGIHFCLMRYSDVLLMFAEADNAINGAPSADAKDALFQVRKRAFPKAQEGAVQTYVNSFGTESAFQGAIENERMWEFAGEGIRKYDLMRWNKYAANISKMKQDSYTIVIEHKMPATSLYKPGAALPTKLYFKYLATDTEDIDVSTANFYDVVDTKPSGYEEADWLKASGTVENIKYYKFLDQVVGGVVKGMSTVQNNGCPYRPIHNSVLTDSRGTLVNDYGF